ncbi:MAG: hypothetical protein ACE5JK_05465 [Candidatus Omnitrophota bacterium]
MMKVLAMLIIVSLMLSGCGTTKFGIENVKIYKTKRDRVDQAIKGNQGYITGVTPSGPVEERKSQRTLIVIDIDVPEDFYPLSTITSIGKDLPEGEEAAPAETEEEITETEEETIK